MSSSLGQLPQPSSNHHRRCLGQLAVAVVQYNQLVQVLLRLSRRVGGKGWGRSGCSKKQHCGNKPITQTHWLVPTSSDHLQGSGPSISSPLSLSAPPHLLLLLEERQTTPLLLCVLVFFCPWKNSKSCKSADGPSRLCVARLCERWNLVCRWKAPEGCLLVNKRPFTEFFCLCSRILLPSLWPYTRIQSPRTSCWFVPALQ